MMSKYQTVIKLEEEEHLSLNSTPEVNSKYASQTIKEELDGESIVTSPFHLLDHGYGRTPQNSIQRDPSLSKTQAVKRKLNLESPTGDEDLDFRSPNKLKKKPIVKTIRGFSGPMKTPNRYDTSLGLLTKKFVELLQRSPRGIVDLNYASASLDVQKRRIYDITNVLEGVGILEKRSKNNIQWRGGTYTESQNDVQSEIEKLEKEEKHLDELIKRAETDMQTLLKETRYAYVSYQDIRSIKEYHDQTVMVIKAPKNASLEVPDPSSGKGKIEMLLKTNKGEIEVFLCPESEPKEKKERKQNASTSKDSDDPLLTDIKLENIKKEQASKSQKVLISEADDFQEPFQLQTEDQHSSEADPDSSFCDEPFLSLEPPITDNDYLYSLDQDEGLMDLFDLEY